MASKLLLYYSDMMQRLLVTSFFLVVLFCCGGERADAALLYFDPGSAELFRGDSVTVSLRLDTDEGECINTIDATIHFDEFIKAVDISRGDSILNIWVEDPVIDEVNHTIRFAGGLPGGYCGRIPGDPSLTNVILKLVFRSPGFTVGGSENDSAHIWLDTSSQVLLHDGYGTPAPLRFQDARIALLSTSGTSISDTWNTEVRADTEIPSDFAITLTKDDVAFSGRYFVVFNASDKQSGIDHYEIMEEPFSEWGAFKWGRADAPWQKVESPYVLEDQTLNSTIRVKALDKAGNVRIVTLVPDTALRSVSQGMVITVAGVGAVVLVLGVLAFYFIWRRRQQLISEEELTKKS